MGNNKEKNFISAIVYLHNNERYIVEFIDKLNNILNENFIKYEIIIVNDHSIDSSVGKIKDYAIKNENSSITIINMSYVHGQEQCINAGIDMAIGDFIYEFDYPYNDWNWGIIIDVYKQSLKGFDIVYAINTKKSNRQQLFYYIFNKYANIKHKISNYSFCLITRRGINRVQSLTTQIPFRNALYANCGLGIYDFKYEYENTNEIIQYTRHSYNVLILFSDIGYKIARNMSLFMALIVMIVIIYTITTFFIGHPIEGWTTTMLLLGISFCCIFLILAVVLKYLSILTNLVFHKKNYVFESIEKLINK